MSKTVSFERSHSILIDATPEKILDYVTNPNSWPEWIAASHHIESVDRPLTRCPQSRHLSALYVGQYHSLESKFEDATANACRS